MKNSIYILFLLFAISLNAQAYQQKEFSVEFPNQQPNQAVDILLGNNFINGWIEVDITGSYSHQNTVGIIKKLFQIGLNPSNWIWYSPTSRVTEAEGPILDNIYIGDIVWDASINQYKLTIYHTSPAANPYHIRLTHHSHENASLNTATLGPIYTNVLSGVRKHSVYYNENVGIGVIDPKNKLDVNGTVHAKEVKVDMAGWADFVFNKDYELPTLDEVEKHIQEKGHLPNIPNTKEVTENGLSLGESQKLLLQKIEELTLYQIQLNKEINGLKQENTVLKRLINNLKNIKK
ncbi:hypothetical protein [Elizabethkingia meningoseptica]|uniref:hypothetical protein n=1 Tax=Elizabethkingia meningoseptica TaxID=238 RepID=UPI00389223C1